MRSLSAYLMILTIFVVVKPAHAVLTLFDSRPPLEAVLGPHELITFEEFPIGPVELCTPITPFIPDPCVFTTQGITFTGTKAVSFSNQRPLLSIDTAADVPLPKGLGSNAIPTAPDQFFLTFSNSPSGIGFDIIGRGAIVVVVVTETDGSVTQIPIFAVTGALTFFGATSNKGIIKISLFDPGSSTLRNFLIDNIVFPPLTVFTVSIDIFPNSINLRSKGVVTAAILSFPSFDAPVQIDPETLTLIGEGVKTIGKNNKLLCSTEDFNGDSLADLVCHFSTKQFFIEPGAFTVALDGQTFDGTPIRGVDSVNIVHR